MRKCSLLYSVDLPLDSAKCLKCRMYRFVVATGRSHRVAPLALLAECSQLYLLCPCQLALHRDCFDKKAQHGFMCSFHSYCQCKHCLPFRHLEEEQRKCLFCVILCWFLKGNSSFMPKQDCLMTFAVVMLHYLHTLALSAAECIAPVSPL